MANQHTGSKYEQYNEEITEMLSSGGSINGTAKKIVTKYKLDISCDVFRFHVRKMQKKIQHPLLSNECEQLGIPIDDVRHYWHKGKSFSIFVKGQQVSYEDIRNNIIAEVASHAPVYTPIQYIEDNEGYLLVIDPADIHLNKLCSAFETTDNCNHDIIYARVIQGIKGIIQKSRGYKIDKILFVAGNDILHVDNPKNTTTAGTHQDVSMMWYDAFVLARKLLVECVEMLLPIAPVHFQYNPSNHDYTNGFFLAQTIQASFAKCENITFDVSMAHRKYYRYGENIIGTTHGDGAKETDLPLLMAHESGKDWYECKHRYYYTHHIHHKKSKEYMSVCVESLRSPSGTDSWHHRNGYQHSPKAVEGYIHCKVNGQVARLTHIF
jgi:hypothetical protein